MSKRKRSPDINDKEAIINKDDSIDIRQRFYKRAVESMRSSTEGLEKTGIGLLKLNEKVDDFLIPEALHLLEKTQKNCDKALELIHQSQRSWISFEGLPHINLKHILSYLDFKDKSNLRLVSKSLMGSVDSLDKTFQAWKLYAGGNILKKRPKFFSKSEKGLKLSLSENYSAKEQLFLCQFSDRVVGLTFNVKALRSMPFTKKSIKMERLNHLSIDGTLFDEDYNPKEKICYLLHPRVLNLTENLTDLMLKEVSLEALEGKVISLPHLKRLVLDTLKDDKYVPNLLTASSATLEEIDFDSIGCEKDREFNIGDTRFPRLKSLILSEGCNEYLRILNCFTPNLKVLRMDYHDIKIMDKVDIDFSTVIDFSLTSISHNSNWPMKLLAAIAPSAQELYLRWRCREENDLKTAFPEFPNLMKLSADKCPQEVLTKIIANSLKLKEIKHSFAKEDVIEFPDLIVNNSNLKDLSIIWRPIKLNRPLDSNQNVLSKLTLKRCDILTGFHSILQACCTTLEELEVYQISDILLEEMPCQMPALKRILIESSRSPNRELSLWSMKKIKPASPKDISRMENLSLLLNQSRSLEKLAISLPEDLAAAKSDLQCLKQCHLPNLKILHIFPKPTKEVVRLVNESFSQEDLTYWFFPWRDAKRYVF